MEDMEDKKAKSIIFKFDMEGNGIVNFDSKDQKYNWNKFLKDRHPNFQYKDNINNDNVNFAKKHWYTNDKDELSYKIKISSDCLRHEMFINEIPFQSPNISDDKFIYLSFLASPSAIVRGYLNTDKTNQYKKKSIITVSPAEQTCNAVSSIEVGSTSGVKTVDENKADNTLHYHETIGNIKYSGEGSIDLNLMQFLSTDPIFDRMGLCPDDFNTYKELLQTKIKSFNSDLNYYYLKTSDMRIPEYGTVFSNEDCIFLVKFFFKKLLNTYIKRRNSYAKVSKIQYKIVYDCTVDKMNDKNGWISIENNKDIENISFETETFFELEPNTEKAKNIRDVFEKSNEKRKEDSKNKKEANAAKAKAAKEAKAAKKQTETEEEIYE
jgi:hypothetical protein